MRPWVQKVYGIAPEQVVGSRGKLKYELHDGKPCGGVKSERSRDLAAVGPVVAFDLVWQPDALAHDGHDEARERGQRRIEELARDTANVA